MKKIALFVILSALLIVTAASAVYVQISAPAQVQVGELLVVTGTTVPPGLSKPSVNPGFSTDIVFYWAEYAKKEIARRTIVVQQDGTFSATFDTRGQKAGRYTVELIDPGRETFGSSSTMMLFVTLIDRSDLITIAAPLRQTFDGTLDISGTIAGIGDAGVQVQVVHESSTVFGPRYIQTDANGAFSQQVSVSSGGTYDVIFSDSTGYIGTATFTVTGPATPVSTAVPEVSASASASRNAPAYFAVDTRSGTVRIATSPGIDWVIEYIDEDGNRHNVNSKGMLDPEEADFVAHGGTVYVKVYPLSYSDSGTVRLTAENAAAVRVSDTAQAVFGDLPTTTRATPVPATLALLALLACLILFAARRR